MASLEVLLQQLTNTLKSVIGAGIENETINLYEYNINEYSLLLKVAYAGMKIANWISFAIHITVPTTVLFTYSIMRRLNLRLSSSKMNTIVAKIAGFPSTPR